MKALIGWIIILGIGIFLGFIIVQDPGYLLIAVAGKQIEMPLWVLGAIAVLLLIAAYIVLRVIGSISGIGAQLQTWWEKLKRRRQAEGMREWALTLLAQDLPKAEKLLSGAPLWESDKKPFIQLLAVKAAAQEGAWELVNEHLSSLPKAFLQHSVVKDLHIPLFKWRLQKASTEMELEATWHAVPADLRRTPSLMHAYAVRCAVFGKDSFVEKFIRKALKQHLDIELLGLYANLSENQTARLAFLETLLEQYPEVAELWHAAALVAAQNQLWGQALHYSAESIKRKPTVGAYAHWASLCEYLEKPTEAIQYMKAGLALAEKA